MRLKRVKLVNGNGVQNEFSSIFEMQRHYNLSATALRRVVKLGRLNNCALQILTADDVFGDTQFEPGTIIASNGDNVITAKTVTGLSVLLGCSKQAVSAVLEGKRPTCRGFFIKRV